MPGFRRLGTRKSRKYPENVLYVYQENAGQSIARNNGIQFAEGKYLNFLDSDDKLDLNALEDVYDLFNSYDDIIDVVTIPRYSFDAEIGPFFLNYKYNANRIVDIENEYDFPQHSISAAFIRKDALSDRFDSRVVISEDSLLINKTILKKCRYGVVSTARYMYRKRKEENSTLNTRKAKREYYIERMEYYFNELIDCSVSRFDYVIPYIQNVLMYDIQWFFLDNTDYILTDEELTHFYELLHNVLKYIDDDIILSQRFLTPILEHHILNVKYKKANFELISNSKDLILSYDNKFFDNLTKYKITITDIYNFNDLLYMKGYFNCYVEGITVNAYFNDKKINLLEIDGEEEYVIGHEISNRFHFATVLELDDGKSEISFKISANSHEYHINLEDKSFVDNIIIDKNKLSIYHYKSYDSFKDMDDSNNLSMSNKEILDEFNSLVQNNEKTDILSFEQEIFGINRLPKVSIIIPVFNPGDLIYRCLNSAKNQSLKEIEIICVDDGSTDNSPQILDKFAKEDARFKVIHQKNQGAGTARNNAIKHSTAEYIIFLDSDDWIEEDMCKKLYIHSKRLDCDLVIFDALWHTADGQINTFSYFNADEFYYDYKTFVFDYQFIRSKLMNGSLGVIWSKFYKSSFLRKNNINFPKHKIYNDVEFHFKSITCAKTISYFPEGFYHYIRLGQPSLQTTFREGKDELIWFDVLNGIYNNFLENNNMDDFRLDFINFSIYYSFDKLKNIELEFYDTFLNNLKSFFERLNPSEDELETLKTSHLTWYNPITVKYYPAYHDLMNDDRESLDFHLLEFKLWDGKNKIENASSDSKEEVYQEVRESLINLDESEDLFSQVPPDLNKFYITVLNFEKYYNFNRFNEGIVKDDLYNINKGKLDLEMKEFNESGLNDKKRENKIIVSLTSFPDRIYDIHYCIYSLLNQDFKPDMVILWLAEEQFPNKEDDLTEELLKLKTNGLTIKWCNDIKPYKKLIPALKEFPDDFIVTVDDDIYYPRGWLGNMWEQYEKSPNTIISGRARRMILNSKGLIQDYDFWPFVKENSESSFLNFPTGAGGILYFPHALNEEVTDEKLFLKLCPSGDDIWFWSMAILNKIKITVIDEPMVALTYVNLARERGVLDELTLWNLNKEGNNNTQMENLVNEFPQIIDIINEI